MYRAGEGDLKVDVDATAARWLIEDDVRGRRNSRTSGRDYNAGGTDCQRASHGNGMLSPNLQWRF